MMRIVLIILIGIHGLIHLFGFLKAFNLSEFNAITHPISKTFGVLWLLAFLLFSITLILYFFRPNYWWLSGFFSVTISQLLIFNYWSDAKFGTIANLIILFAAIVANSYLRFENQLKEERNVLYQSAHPKNLEIIDKQSFNNLPLIIQKWLSNSGVIGKQDVSNVYLTQELLLKLKPEQKNWSTGKAEQYFTVYPPAFSWNISTEMNSILNVVGRDKFKDGKGEMLIKLLSMIPVANAKHDKKVDQATLQRYLAEIVWFPSASLSQYIKWEAINDYSARATMEYDGTKGTGEFHFDANGNFEKFVTMRYRDPKDKVPTQWTVIATKTKEINGIKIPVECEASWELEGSEWTWLKLKITDIWYNVNAMPIH